MQESPPSFHPLADMGEVLRDATELEQPVPEDSGIGESIVCPLTAGSNNSS